MDTEENFLKVDLERSKIECIEKILNMVKNNNFASALQTRLENLSYEILEQSLKNIKEL